jgi:hypothetical protein
MIYNIHFTEKVGIFEQYAGHWLSMGYAILLKTQMPFFGRERLRFMA